MKVNKLKWDSDFFKVNIGKVELGIDQSIGSIQDLNEYNLIYFFVDPGDITSNQILLQNKALLVDEKVTYSKKVEIDRVEYEEIISYRRKFCALDKEVVRIGLQSGKYSRFRIDSNLGQDAYKNLYELWVNKSIDREIAKEVFVYMEQGIPKGVITLGVKDGRADIGILAVDEFSRGKDIGKKLIYKVEAYCNANGYQHLQVVTQKSNTLACKFYEKCGFLVESVINIYHYWPNK